MATTPTYSFRYPLGSDVVDVANDIYKLATDVEGVLTNQFLKLSGGTLTGLIGITSGANTFNFKNGASNTTPYLHVGTSPGKSIAMLAGSGGAGIIYQNDASFSIGVDSRANLDAGTSSGGTSFLTMTSTGATTLTGDLTVSKASTTVNVAATTGHAALRIKAESTYGAELYFTNNANQSRWVLGKSTTAESGSNAGSDLVLYRYSDAGSSLGILLTATRSTGLVTLTGDLTISKGAPALTLSSSAGNSVLYADSPAGSSSNIWFRTGTSRRWTFIKDSTAESGSNAGSDLVITRADDSGNYLADALKITRSTGLVTLTGDLTISKASAVARINSTSGNVDVNIDRINGQTGFINFRTGTSKRWIVGVNNDAETAPNNYGSDFYIDAYDDSGNWLGNGFSISRRLGKATLWKTGATSGLELGLNGPRMMSGTGIPEGVVTAPVGSIWYQTDSIVGVTHWRKASGTGNTGWVVMEGDTGWRKCTVSDTAVFTNSTYNTANPDSHLFLRRVGNTIQLRFNTGLNSHTTNYQTIFTLPVGFRTTAVASPTSGTTGPWIVMNDGASVTTTTKILYQTATTTSTYLNGYAWTAGAAYVGHDTYLTNDAWPTSLPGV